MKRDYTKPALASEKCFESSALACGKVATPPAGSRHFDYSYDTFTGHLGAGFNPNSSSTGQGGVGFGPTGATSSYGYPGLCANWVSIIS